MRVVKGGVRFIEFPTPAPNRVVSLRRHMNRESSVFTGTARHGTGFVTKCVVLEQAPESQIDHTRWVRRAAARQDLRVMAQVWHRTLDDERYFLENMERKAVPLARRNSV